MFQSGQKLQHHHTVSLGSCYLQSRSDIIAIIMEGIIASYSYLGGFCFFPHVQRERVLESPPDYMARQSRREWQFQDLLAQPLATAIY